MGQYVCIYLEPSSVGEVDAADLAAPEVLNKPVDGGVNVMDTLARPTHMELWHHELDPQLMLQIRYNCVHRIIVFYRDPPGLLVIRPPNVGHDDRPSHGDQPHHGQYMHVSLGYYYTISL